jgi:hypothetical protein
MIQLNKIAHFSSNNNHSLTHCYIVEVSCIGGEKHPNWIKALMCCKSLSNIITQCCIKFNSPCGGNDCTS